MIHNWIHDILCLLENNENRKVAASLANPYFQNFCEIHPSEKKAGIILGFSLEFK